MIIITIIIIIIITHGLDARLQLVHGPLAFSEQRQSLPGEGLARVSNSIYYYV